VSNKQKILLVDDDHDYLFILEHTLSKLDIEIFTANSGKKALEYEEDFAVIILDVQMPGMDGFETAEKLRVKELTQRTPIIFLTAGDIDNVANKGYESGAVDYLNKPVDNMIFISKINVFLELDKKNQELKTEVEERKKSGDRLKVLTAELEESNQCLKEFSHTVAHDLKNPLSMIQSLLDIIKHKDDYDVNIDQLIDNGIKTGNRMQKLIDDLLNYAKNNQELKSVTEINLNTIVEDVINDLMLKIREVDADIEIGSLPIIMGSYTQIYQVFLNLISNGLKFTPKGKSPVIKVSSNKIDMQNESTTDTSAVNQITVEDNGIGFDVKDHDSIFKAFNQLNSNSEYEGSGIGLATVKKIISYHGGNIRVTSSLGNGAKFIITLPVDLKNDVAPVVLRELRISSDKGKVVKSRLYKPTGKSYTLKILDESEHGLSCICDGIHDLTEGSILNLEGNKKYEVRWIKQKDDSKTMFGMKLI
jgi:two-component system, sensor histidine kinase and response regulator